MHLACIIWKENCTNYIHRWIREIRHSPRSELECLLQLCRTTDSQQFQDTVTKARRIEFQSCPRHVTSWVTFFDHSLSISSSRKVRANYFWKSCQGSKSGFKTDSKDKKIKIKKWVEFNLGTFMRLSSVLLYCRIWKKIMLHHSDYQYMRNHFYFLFFLILLGKKTIWH